MTTELICSLSVPDLVRERASRLEVAQAAMDDPLLRPFLEHLSDWLRYPNNVMSAYETATDRHLWSRFIQGAGLWDLMSSAERDKWTAVWSSCKQLHASEVPPFTAETALAVFQDLHERKGELRREALLALFWNLSWDHKTNQPALFGKKLIYQHFCDAVKQSDGDIHLVGDRQHAANRMSDLLRELYRMDGKPEPSGWWKLAAEGYVRVERFKNGNAHLHLLRPDLVDKLNAELATFCPGALPAPKRRKGVPV